MLKRKAILAAITIGLGFLPSTVPAADVSKEEIKKNTFTDPAKATPDFLMQGEYVGEVEIDGKKTPLAAQIASVGGGDFIGAFYLGGLPGAGWDGKSRFEVTGKAVNAAIALNGRGGKGFSGAIQLDKLKGWTEEGAAFELTKIERKSPTLGAKPPAGAIVLFDGSNVDEWEKGSMDERKLLAAGTKTKRKFKNFTMHAEFLLPFKPYGRDQDRGNSGFYIQERYELQVLDTFSQKPVFNGTGAMYRQTPPDLNMCLPPLQWQTYDIDFTSAEFDSSGKKTKNAMITVKLNGVTIHDKRELPTKTGAGKPEGPEAGPIQLQGHGNPVFYQNIWIVEK